MDDEDDKAKGAKEKERIKTSIDAFGGSTLWSAEIRTGVASTGVLVTSST